MVGKRGTLYDDARIFLKNPSVLILDEATLTLDSMTEATLQETFDKLSRTTTIIVYRLSAVWNADRIAVIKDGRVVELGSLYKADVEG